MSGADPSPRELLLTVSQPAGYVTIVTMLLFSVGVESRCGSGPNLLAVKWLPTPFKP